jgi:hypothetical protein
LSKVALYEWYQQLTASAGEYTQLAAAAAAGTAMPQQDAEQQDTVLQRDQAPSSSSSSSAAAEVKPDARGQGTYAGAKSVNAGYTRAKALLHQHFERRTQQAWLKVTDFVPELEGFTG